MPIHHVGLSCSPATFKAMRDFYVEILKPLGYTIFMGGEKDYLGMQHPVSGPDFWLNAGGNPDLPQVNPEDYSTKEKRNARDVMSHIAFAVDSKEKVHEWYDVAIKAGGIDNGKPGERPEYTKGYYAAFVIDPLGNNIEAVNFVRPAKEETSAATA